MELREALGQITEIRQQMARSEVFRGYRSVTVGSVGLMGVLAAIAQPYLVPSPTTDLKAYLTLWITVAAVACLLVAWGLWRRGLVGSSNWILFMSSGVGLSSPAP